MFVVIWAMFRLVGKVCDKIVIATDMKIWPTVHLCALRPCRAFGPEVDLGPNHHIRAITSKYSTVFQDDIISS